MTQQAKDLSARQRLKNDDRTKRAAEPCGDVGCDCRKETIAGGPDLNIACRLREKTSPGDTRQLIGISMPTPDNAEPARGADRCGKRAARDKAHWG